MEGGARRDAHPVTEPDVASRDELLAQMVTRKRSTPCEVSMFELFDNESWPEHRPGHLDCPGERPGRPEPLASSPDQPSPA
jgi:hypothetical protein